MCLDTREFRIEYLFLSRDIITLLYIDIILHFNEILISREKIFLHTNHYKKKKRISHDPSILYIYLLISLNLSLSKLILLCKVNEQRRNEHHSGEKLSSGHCYSSAICNVQRGEERVLWFLHRSSQRD